MYLSLPTPPGATSVGATVLSAFVRPQLSSINLGPYGNVAPADLYNGVNWSSPVPSADNYSMQNELLTLSNQGTQYAGTLSTASTRATAGNVPLLPNKAAWYARTRMKNSQAAVGCFPAFWLEPTQHNTMQTDKTAAGEEMWLEFDGYEGGGGTGRGEGAGMWGGVIAWCGPPGGYKSQIFKNPYTDLLFDPSQWHDYGIGWNPSGLTEWWMDDVLVGSVNLANETLPAGFLAWILNHTNAVIFGNTGSPPYPPYSMQIADFSTWVAP